tara:strand:- start:85 stop:636 length:552 start_codon:yes stop_codon:yes gene_type:complete
MDCWYIKDYFSLKQRKEICKAIEKNYDFTEKEGKAAKTFAGQSKKKTKTLVICWKKIKDIVGELEHSIYEINLKNFGYNIKPFDHSDYMLLNIYDSKTKAEYDWHFDSSKSEIYDCKLSVIANLSDSYEGGEFWLWPGDPYKVKECTPGSLIVFKSYINHKVTPVTKGIRKTLTLFCHGPRMI